ncbi:DUF742 domain-containing protein [Streptomyces sp. RKND-216]|uniref:DUF742 domain-containing protein n=1 Tax=Streptomyces sp. RKND-216 TaxID=2562581 RepID=UPI00109DA13F|nr:DUF742 domain-containing protein [Streptomyces sp. RKND-216]THA24323.1 DUF742 domain-containing protein [Streptomyces sp. RKND-216]
MTTSPGGPSYGDGREQQQGSPLKRFNFPSAPSERVASRPAPAQAPADPQPYDTSPHYDEQPQRPERPLPPQPQHHSPTPPPHRIEPVQPPQHRPEPGSGGPRGGDFDVDDGRSDQQPLVRPYAMTGGRTRPRYQLAIEALVHTTADSAQLQGQLPEHQRICRLCYEIKSVAEISALLSIPLGVARILVADLAEAGLVAIHQPGGGDSGADGQPDVTLLERVLSGLRKL